MIHRLLLLIAVMTLSACAWRKPVIKPGSPESELVWHDAQELLVEGKGWTDTENFYERLPARAEEVVTPAVWRLSKNPANVTVRFATNSKRIGAEWDGGGGFNHMAPTGVSGLDLYRRGDGSTRHENWVYLATGRPLETRTAKVLKGGLSGEMQEYMLFLPLYQNLTDLRIGIDADADITIPEPRTTRPIVFYGTSITQGGCASRTGMCHTAILGRWLDLEIINLGFSGAGKMEMPMADLLGELDPSLYVIDCLPNMTGEMARERVVPFVKRLRELRPDTPILMVGNPSFPPAEDENLDLINAIEQLKAEGVRNLHHLPGDHVMPGEEEATVDDVHPTDLGFLRMAEAFHPVILSLLQTQTAAR